MRRSFRITGYVLAGVLATLALLVIALFLLTRTEWGVEQVGRITVAQLEDEIEGELEVGRVTSPGLLGEATLHDVVIDDPKGRPFARIDSARIRYDWRTLLSGSIVLEQVRLYEPLVYIEELPGDTAWNYEYVFPDTTPDDEPDDLVLFEDAQVQDGTLVVRTPWEPDPGEAEDPERVVLRSVPGGLVREYRFEDLDATLPRVLWDSPVEEGRLIEIASLSSRGYVWETPFDLRDLRGEVTVRDSLISFDAPAFRLPVTRGSGFGQIITGEDRVLYDLQISGDTVALNDLQWLYPALPETGGGHLDLRIQSQQPRGTLWYASDVRLSAPGTEIAGQLGIVTGDTLYFTRVDLRASPLDLALLEDVLPGELPVEGLLVGTVEVEGPLSAARTEGTLAYTGAVGPEGRAAVRWSGVLDLTRRGLPRRLHAEVDRLDAELVRALRPGLRLPGRFSGTIDVTEGEDRAVEVAAELRHELEDRPESVFQAVGSYRPEGPGRGVDLQVSARSVDLAALASAVPGLPRLVGTAHGDAHIGGPLDDLVVDAEIETPAGPLVLDGRADVTGAESGYSVGGRFTDFDVSAFASVLPEAPLTGRFSVQGERGLAEGDTVGLRLTLEDGRIGALGLRDGAVDARIADGLLHVDTLTLRADAGRLTGDGSFGLASGRTGTLDLVVDSESLEPLRPLLVPDTVLLDENDREDPWVAGELSLRGSMTGGLSGFDASAELSARDFTYDEAEIGRAELRFDATALATGAGAIRLEGDASGLALGRRVLSTARVEAEYGPDGGELSLDAGAPGNRAYRLVGRLERTGETSVFELRELRLRAGDDGWTLSGPAVVRLDPGGATVRGLGLTRIAGDGRVHVTGRLPWRDAAASRSGVAAQPADFSVELDGIPLDRVLRLAQSDVGLDGMLGGRIQVRGSADSPTIESELEVDGLRLDGLALSRLSSEIVYANRTLNMELSAWDGDRRVIIGGGALPVDLALMPVEERRLAEPVDITLQAERTPAALLTSLVRGFRGVEGWLDGQLVVRGTTRDPALGGSLVLSDGAAVWEPTGVGYRDVEATFRVLGERVVAVDGRARTDGDAGGVATVTGSITFQPLNDPEFDLVGQLDAFQAARRPEVDLTATGELRLQGRYTRPVVTGGVRVDGGALHLDELVRQRRIVELEDPLPIDLVDSLRVEERTPLPTRRNVFLENLSLDATLEVGRDFWLRGRNINVELNGEVTVDRRGEDLRLTGTLNAMRGSYQLRVYNLYARRFTVRGGTVEFVGTPGMDPNLDITAGYRVRTRQGDALDVLAQVGGTLRDPRVQLTSDSESPISETDLASYLIFGRPRFALGPGESRLLGQQTDLAGQAAGLASLGMQAIAPTVLGDVASGLESALNLDYFAITSPELGRPATVFGGDASALQVGAELEAGRYLQPNLYLSITGRITSGSDATTAQSLGRCSEPGFRLEWRFRPTWLTELFLECRFSPYNAFGVDGALRDRQRFGFFFAREWGY